MTNTSMFHFPNDPPGETGIQLSQRQLDMKKKRSVSDRPIVQERSRSQSAHRLPQRTPAMEAPNGIANESRQQPFRTRSTLKQRQIDPPSAASLVGGGSSRPNTKSVVPPTEENDMESQRALVRSLLGGSRRNSNNPGKRKDPEVKPVKQASFKDKFRKRVFGRSKSPMNSGSKSKQSSQRNLNLLSKQTASSYPVPKLCNTSSTDSSVPERSISDMSPTNQPSTPTVVDEAYTHFVGDLSLEVAGAHSQLSASFRSCITGEARTVRPAQKRQLQPESVKILEDVHTHYHEIAPRAKDKQMVNDRTYRKESKGRRKSSIEHPASIGDVGQTTTANQVEILASNADKQTVTQTNQKPVGAAPEMEQSVASRSELLPAEKSPPSKIALMAKKFGSAASISKQSQVSIPSGKQILPEQREEELSMSNRSDQDAVDNRGAPIREIGSTGVEPPGPSIPAKPNLRRVEPVSRPTVMGASCAAELKLTPPRLRRVAVEPKQKSSPAKSTAPWANFALKPVKRAESKPVHRPEQQQEGAEEDRSAPSQPIVNVVDKAESVEPSEPVVISVEDMSESGLPHVQYGTAPEPFEMFDEEELAGSEILAIIDLKSHGPSTSKATKVVLGKQCIRQIQQNRNETHGVVQWKVNRDCLEPDGMTLNMQSLTVQLLLRRGKSKALVFASSEDCLRFATTFYNASSLPPNEVIETHSTCSSVRLDSLNDEEQSVLEKYRELRTSRGHEDAFNETVSSRKLPRIETSTTKAPEIASHSELTAEEEASVQKYRGLLQKSLPVGAVKHRMALERASQKVVDVIILEADEMDLPTTISTGALPSSPVSTFTSTSTATKSEDSKLSVGEEMMVKRYAMMLKNGVPPDAVRHKLMQDNIPMKLVSAIFSQPAPRAIPSSTGSLTPEEETTVSKYRKTLKMGVPPDAVRHKMTQDQIAPKLINIVLEESDEEKEQDAASSLSPEDQAVVAKYRKMLKMGIPSVAVRHEMAKEQIDQKLITVVIGDNTSENPSHRVAISKKTTKKSTNLTAEEESIAAEYRKLLKRQVPRDALQFRMVKEGVNNKIIAAVLGASAVRDTCDQSKSSGSASTSSNLINLHWNAMENAPGGSIWRTFDDSPEPDRCDFAQLLERFQKKPATSKRGPVRSDASVATGKAKLLDLTRSNNIAISLKSFKEFDYTELANILAFLDPCRNIRGERSQFLRDLLPTTPELRIMSEYQGSDDRLVPAELWFCKLRGIKRLETKARVIRTMEMFTTDASEVRGNFRMLGQVCTQVVESKKLQAVLKMVLHIGNVMNEGTRMGGASGFKFDSLLRLTQTKTADGKMTLLDYMVCLFFERDEGDTLTLIVDFPELHTACRLLINDMKNEVKILSDALAECRTELKNLEKDQSNPSMTEKSGVSASSAGDPRAQLFAAIAARGDGGEATKPANFQKREQFLAAMEAKKKTSSPNSSTDVENDARKPASQRIENNIVGGTTRLRNFIDSVEDSFTRLETQRDEALVACRTLSTYCGEAGGISSTTTLLDVLSQFVRNVESSVKKRTQVEQRKAAKAKKSSQAEKDVVSGAKSSKGASQGGVSKGVIEQARNGGHSMKAPPFTPGSIFQGVGKNAEKNISAARGEASEEQTAGSEKSPQGGKSLVLMVNDVLKKANPAFKEDFKKGRVMHDPSDKLKEIYDREQHLVLKPTPDKDQNSGKATSPNENQTPGSKDEGDSFYSCEGDDSRMAGNATPVEQAGPSKLTPEQPSPKQNKKPDEVRLALEEISKITSIEDTQRGVRTSLFERARNKREQKSSQPNEQQIETTQDHPAAFESATARSARKKRMQMREDRGA